MLWGPENKFILSNFQLFSLDDIVRKQRFPKSDVFPCSAPSNQLNLIHINRKKLKRACLKLLPSHLTRKIMESNTYYRNSQYRHKAIKSKHSFCHTCMLHRGQLKQDLCTHAVTLPSKMTLHSKGSKKVEWRTARKLAANRMEKQNSSGRIYLIAKWLREGLKYIRRGKIKTDFQKSFRGKNSQLSIAS